MSCYAEVSITSKDECLKLISMKLFSMKRPVTFCDGQVKIEDLAYNHPYKKEGNHLVLKGADKQTKWDYTVLFNLKGELELVILKQHARSVALLPWKEEYDVYETLKIKPNGDILSRVCKYQTTSQVKHKLFSKSFSLHIGDDEQNKEFMLDNKGWRSRGDITIQHRQAWLCQ